MNAALALEQAHRSLEAGAVLLDAGFAPDVVNRAYYATFHGARAALISLGVTTKTHRGVHVLLNDRLVRTGRLPAEAARWLAFLADARASADYEDGTAITDAQAREALDLARRFLALIESFIADDPEG